ncbi:chaperone protein DnaJ [bacterium BMS3Abin07]|nr:chaperone protein DnaJ [bacterium BMS3Abin07]GBE32285.1 chaperone protein DnaJ [bacterium BMS3Bbin05]HDL19791.1 DUF4388 domain-containing protein [Nitrospirota bacterium]HDO21290.1 DUF4388 domain-containing protein [Nitrospirota bacterium]HDZ88814.1 DUF4388 domain-containing protein [Nitrospirota bacterium]
MGKENRCFKRFRRRIALNLSFDGTRLDAEAVDYSITGIGAVLDDDPDIPRDLNLNLSMSGFDIGYGRLAWKKKTASGMRVGIELIGPVRGSLEFYRLSDLLIGLQRTGKTGTLEVRSGAINKKIYIKNGDMVYATSSEDSNWLGDVMLHEGGITQEQYDRTAEIMKETGKKQGAVMVELGYLKPRDLFIALKRQVEKVIVDLFSLETGSFHFHEGPLPKEDVVVLNLSAANLIYSGIKSLRNEEYICGLFHAFDTVFRLSPDPLDLFQDIKLDDDDKDILALIDGKRMIKDILSLSSLSETDTLKTLFMLSSANIVQDISEIVSDEFTESPDLETEVEEDTISAMGEQTVEVPHEFIEKVEDLHGRLDKLGHYDIFGLDENASSVDIKRAYYSLAKEFHPDRHFHLNGDIKDKLSAIFTSLTNAYSTLNSPQKRSEYNETRKDGGTPVHSSGEEAAVEKFEAAIVEFKRGEYEEASRLFAQASYMDNSSAKYYYYYGFSLMKLKKFREAEKEIRNALRIDPVNPAYLAEAGHIYLKLGFPLRAKSNFEKALKTEPVNKRALEGMENLSRNIT